MYAECDAVVRVLAWIKFKHPKKECRYNDVTPSQGDIFSEVSKTGIFLQ
jgi:hypothetical protein